METIQSQASSPYGYGHEEKHSGLGIASFVLSIVIGFLMLVLFCVAGYLHAHRTPGANGYSGQMLVGMLVMGLMAADVIAVGLGIAALCQKGKKRLFGILGLAFSVLTVLGTVGLIVLGLMLKAHSRA